MEYIGATGVPVTFKSVPIDDNIDFHFILGFAIDASPSGEPQDGTFSPYWVSTLTPASVAQIKSRHPNVKALASLSGWSLGDKVLRWYDPEDPDRWISNAFASLKSIVESYNLDGIDVDYEKFHSRRGRSSPNSSTFAYCIGELISLLKNQTVISVATIAPFYTTVGPYMDLYGRYRDVIDYVNYQFYTDRVRNARGFLDTFRLRSTQFDAGKLLPSYEVGGRGIQGDAFFDALRLLGRSGFGVNGVMIFSADASAEDDYYYERKSQAFLLNSTVVL
ncbi:2S globulin [Trema orientale]|uniref:2S globulin n=1 Tax=Trema orientale TaxID=63057 RepID=A0A2P5E9M9_TREOI|nr:2S globulin [Trema orientale]